MRFEKFKEKEDKKIIKYDIIDQFILNYIIYPILPIIVSLGFSPNFITTLSLISGIISAYSLYYENIYIGAFLFLLRYVLDCLDGPVARITKQTSKFGDIYDHLVDYFCFSLFYSLCFTKSYSSLFIIFLHIIAIICVINYSIIYQEIKKGIIYDLTYWIPINKNLYRLSNYIGTGTGIFTVFITIGIIINKN